MGSKILLADDDTLVRVAIQKILKMFHHDVVAVESGRQVLEQVSEDFDVIILDINMPDMDGFETLERLNQLRVDIPVLFLTGAGSMDYAVKAINLGAYDFLTKPIADIELFHVKVKQAAEKKHFLRQEKAYKKNLEREVQAKTQELAEKNILLEQYSNHLENATVQIMSSLQAAMEEKDGYTAGHTKRVTEYAVFLGEAALISHEDMLVLRRASQFHDIGKLVIDLSCIQKPGKLTDEEWVLIRKHPSVGAHRNIGLFGILDLVRSQDPWTPITPFNGTSDEMKAIGKYFRDNGLYVMVPNNSIHTNPPLCITEDQLAEGFAIIDKALDIADEAVTG